MEQAFGGSNAIWSSWTFKRSKKPVWCAFVYLANSLASLCGRYRGEVAGFALVPVWHLPRWPQSV